MTSNFSTATMHRHRHRSSLEDVLDFSPTDFVFENNGQRQRVEALFVSLLDQLAGEERLSTPFRRVEMLRLMHQYARTQQSKDLFLRSFFSSMQIDMAVAVDVTALSARAIEFTDYLISNFFLPCEFVSISSSFVVFVLTAYLCFGGS